MKMYGAKHLALYSQGKLLGKGEGLIHMLALATFQHETGF